MSQIRIPNKKTGEIRVYETIPDSYTKSGQPRKRFIGTEGPDGTLIPPAPRKRKSSADAIDTSMEDEIQKTMIRIAQLQEKIAELVKKRDAFNSLIQNILGILSDAASVDDNPDVP